MPWPCRAQDGRYGLYAPATGGMEMLDLRTGKVCKTLIPKVLYQGSLSRWSPFPFRLLRGSLTSLQSSMPQMSLFFTTTGCLLTFILATTIHSISGRKTIRAFRRKDGKMIANFRVQVLNLCSAQCAPHTLTPSPRLTSRAWRPPQMGGLLCCFFGHSLQVRRAGDGGRQHDHPDHRRPREGGDRGVPEVASLQARPLLCLPYS
jgi:hypothetical protein